MIKRFVCFGATSKIAHETLKNFAKDEVQLCLIAKDEKKLEEIAKDLEVRAGKVATRIVANLGVEQEYSNLFEKVFNQFGDFDACLLAHGILGDQPGGEKNYLKVKEVLEVNTLSSLCLLTDLANYFEQKGKGIIAVISSVAGERGRKSNYIYGTSKAALSVFTAGLRNRLAKKGVSVLTIKPGFVKTPMTAHLKQGLLFASPEEIGQSIYKAINTKKDIVYLPWFWRVIMFIINSIPEFIFKKTSI